MPQVKYPWLKDDRENHILACRSCNSIKSDFDPDPSGEVYSGKAALTMQQRTQLFAIAKAKVCEQMARMDAKFKEEVEFLRPLARSQPA